MADILIVDDDQSVVTAFQRFLDFEGHRARIASNADEAMQFLAEREPDLVMMDIRMPGIDGLQTLQQMRDKYPDLIIVMMTGYGTSQTSIDAIRAGAFDYLVKPLDLDQLRDVIGKALAATLLRGLAASAASTPDATVGLVGESAAMVEVYKMIGRLAINDVPALVTGERGTGKRLVVATIHDNSARRDQPFVSVDCQDVTDASFEGEFAAAGAGTLHLEHVDALPRALQIRIERLLAGARGREAALRASQPRILASTTHDLSADRQAGTFSRELHDALSVITISLPPLRERREDIPLLVRHFIQRTNADLGRAIRDVDEHVARRLQSHHWPGNVGELERVIKRACIVARTDVITEDDIGTSLTDSRAALQRDTESSLGRAVRTALHERLAEAGHGSVYHDIVEIVEATLVGEALVVTNGNQVKASEILGLNRATLRKKIPND
jgi:DNA-binding NtrC family response regulator